MTRRLRHWALLGAAGAVALAAGLGFALWDRTPPDASALLALSLPDTNGTSQSLGQWRGKVLVVNYWATWCGPCREEMPEFVRAQRDLGPKGLQIVGIAIDQKSGAICRRDAPTVPSFHANGRSAHESGSKGSRLRLLAEKFTQRGKRFQVIADDFQYRQQRHGKDGARHSPGPSPKNQPNKNDQGIER